MPVYLVFFVTHRCVGRCGHCFNWPRRLGIKQTDELTIDEIENISRSLNPMIFMFLTGGEPFIRDDLPEIAKIFYVNNKIFKYQIPSNGWFTEKVILQMEEIAQSCPKAHVSVTISIDGIEDEHDRIRGVKGLFAKAIQTIKEIQKLAKFYSNIGVNAEITVSAYNQHTLTDTFRYLTEKIGVTNFFAPLVRGDPKDPNCKTFNIELYEKLHKEIAEKFLAKVHLGYTNFPFASVITYKDMLLRKAVSDIIKNNQNIVPCIAGRLYGILYANGDVEPCEMVNRGLGNVREFRYDFKNIWLSKKAKRIKDEIIKKKCFCTHECALSASLLSNPKFLLKILFERLKGGLKRVVKNSMLA